MKILLAAATEGEISPLKAHLEQHWKQLPGDGFEKGVYSVTLLITGAGMVAATYALAKTLQTGSYDMAIQAGIGGSFNRDIRLGDIVAVQSDRFGDMGAEDGGEGYIDIFDLGFADGEAYPFSGRVLQNPGAGLPAQAAVLRAVKGLTVNTVTGNEKTAARLIEAYGCDTESMEGAAFHYVCLREKIPFMQVRAISNYVERRDRSKWQIGPAVDNLNKWLIEFFEKGVKK